MERGTNGVSGRLAQTHVDRADKNGHALVMNRNMEEENVMGQEVILEIVI